MGWGQTGKGIWPLGGLARGYPDEEGGTDWQGSGTGTAAHMKTQNLGRKTVKLRVSYIPGESH